MRFIIKRIYKKTYRLSRTRNKRRFLRILRQINFKINDLKMVYIKVDYGRLEDVYGHHPIFINEGEYTSKKELMKAGRCFSEK